MADKTIAFASDIISVVQRYRATAKKTLLGGNEFSSHTANSSSNETKSSSLSLHSSVQQLRDDDVLIKSSLERYKSLSASEQKRWLSANKELKSIHISARQRELEMVRIVFSNAEARKQLLNKFQERAADHINKLDEHRMTSSESLMTECDSARSLWGKDVCKSAVTHLRQDWRANQHTVLRKLAVEMASWKQIVTSNIQDSHTALQTVHTSSAGAWSNELQHREDVITQILKTFEAALIKAYEAMLCELQGHITKQTTCCKAKVHEAMHEELSSREQNALQLRRMQIALIKWQRLYLNDAYQKSLNSPDSNVPTTDKMSQNDRALLDKLQAACIVLEKLRESLPIPDDEACFVSRQIEASSPCCLEVVMVYERYLSEHGIFSGLGETSLPASMCLDP